MFGIGMWELGVIFVVALLIFGPKRLPELARTLGKGMAEFRRASNDLRQSFNLDVDAPPRKSAPPPPRPTPPVTGDPREQRESSTRPPQALDGLLPTSEPESTIASPESAPAAEPKEPDSGGV